MDRRLRLSRWLAAALLALPAGGAVEPAQPDAPTAADCAFSHPNLPGFCRVTVPVSHHSTPKYACEAVLHCINATVCADAQKYCPNPGVAKVWKLASAAPAAPRANCAFSNAGYNGWCRLAVPMAKGATPQQACEGVAACLNHQPCPGFVNLCQPEILSGWRVAEATAAGVQAPSK